jgi:hypothetical protein
LLYFVTKKLSVCYIFRALHPPVRAILSVVAAVMT